MVAGRERQSAGTSALGRTKGAESGGQFNAHALTLRSAISNVESFHVTAWRTGQQHPLIVTDVASSNTHSNEQSDTLRHRGAAPYNGPAHSNRLRNGCLIDYAQPFEYRVP